MKIPVVLLAICACLFTPLSAYTQTRVRLSGSVRKSVTGESLPGATMRMAGTTLGTTTNTDGRYRLLLEPGKYTLIVSYVGFNPDTSHFTAASHDTTINFYLVQSQLPLPEVVVYPDSVNPADEIIQRAVNSKKKWMAELGSYDFNAYTKTVLKTISNDVKADTLIDGILETQTKGYWRAPDSYLEVVTARRQTANFTSDQNIFTPGHVLNFNDDLLRIDRYSIPGPTSPSAFEDYDFSIQDTVYQGTERIFRISVIPKENSSPLFKGFVEIVEGSYALARARLALSDPAALQPIDSIVYDEQFAEYHDLYWLPIYIRTTFSVKFVIPPVPRIYFENTSVLYDYSINPKFRKGFFDRKYISSKPDEPDSTAWQNAQILPLTHEEVRAYTRLDSITRNLPFVLKAILSVTRFASEPNLPMFTSISDIYHFNRVEGSYLGIGLTSSSLVNGAKLTVIGGRGFSDKMWKYDISAEYELPFAYGVSVGGRAFQQLENREEEDIFSRFEITIGALLYRDDYRDYYLSRGWHGLLKWKLSSSFESGLRYADERQTSVRNNTDYSIFSEDYSYSINPPIDDGRMRSVQLSVKLDTRKYLDMGMSMASDQGINYWVTEAAAEISSKQFLNSSFSFNRYRVSVVRHQMTFASSFANVWFVGGASTGKLPLQRMFEIQAAYGGYSERSVLSTLSTQRILSDRSIVAGFEHDFPNTFFKWTNIPVVRSIWFDLALFVHGAAAPGLSPMGEAGFGLVNVLPFIQTDFTWGVAGMCSGFAWTISTSLEF